MKDVLFVFVAFLFFYGLIQVAHKVIAWQRKHEDKSWKNKS
jgi:hypothetical protein